VLKDTSLAILCETTARSFLCGEFIQLFTAEKGEKEFRREFLSYFRSSND
jgi:hypothetical protein